MHEIETKILNVDPKAVAARLEELGARQVQDTKLVVDWYRPKGTKPGEDPWYLRIRSYADGTHEVTWKGRSEVLGTARRHREINLTVSDHAACGELFEEVDLERYAHQEKYRTSWELKDWRFDLDEYPGMPPYLEIEGQSEEHVTEAVRLLGLTGHRASPEGEKVLIESEYGLNWCDMKF